MKVAWASEVCDLVLYLGFVRLRSRVNDGSPIIICNMNGSGNEYTHRRSGNETATDSASHRRSGVNNEAFGSEVFPPLFEGRGRGSERRSKDKEVGNEKGI